MRRCLLALAMPALVVPSLVWGGGTAFAEPGAAERADCVITEVSALTGADPRSAGEVEGVRTVVEGAVPPDVGRTVAGVVTELMDQTGPVRTAVTPVARGVVVDVRGVAGELPAELPAELSGATACALGGGGDDPAGGAPTHGDRPARSASVDECRVTSVVPVDAEGEATTVAGEVEGVVIGTAGPLPTGVESTVASTFAQLGTATSDLAVTVVQTAGEAQITVEGVAGPLPADLSHELAMALDCRDTTPPPDPGPADSGPGGSGPGSGSGTGSGPATDSGPGAGSGAGTGADGASPGTAQAPFASVTGSDPVSGPAPTRGSLPNTGGDTLLGVSGAGALATAALFLRRLLKRIGSA